MQDCLWFRELVHKYNGTIGREGANTAASAQIICRGNICENMVWGSLEHTGWCTSHGGMRKSLTRKVISW